MSMFQSVTGATAKDCIIDDKMDRVIFVINPGEMGLAIGKNGVVIKKEQNVNEDMSLEPLTDYSKFKADCEKILNKYQSESFTTVTIRPATVCGYSPRQRLDVIVNILTNYV